MAKCISHAFGLELKNFPAHSSYSIILCSLSAFLFFSFLSQKSFGQIQEKGSITFPQQNNQQLNPLEPNNGEAIIQRVNENAMKVMGYNPAPTQEDILRDLEKNRHGQFSLSQQEQKRKELYAIISEDETHGPVVPQANTPFAELGEKRNCFIYARKELEKILNGKQTISLKKAVYLSEYPIQKNSVQYKVFLRQIERLVAICNETLKENNKKSNDPDAIHWAIQRLFKDTFKVTLNAKRITVHPFTYDFEDFEGRKDIRKFFVTKLLKTHTGQCHSMPLLYAILAQELHVKASIAFSPNHTFIKYWNHSGWHDFETTSGCFPGDIDYVSSGYITGESIQNGIYMRPNSLRETIAECLADLLTYYENCFEEDQFVLSGANFILNRFPHNTQALLIKAGWVNGDFKRLHKQLGKPKYADLNKHPDLQVKVGAMKAINDQMDALGFADMPDEAYQAWLKSLKAKQENQMRKTKQK